MYIYAGIDEVGYGPMFGPLVVGRTVLGIADLPADSPPPDLWKRLEKVVCRERAGGKKHLVVNDSKKVYSPATGLHHLELSVLCFAALAGHQPQTVEHWLDCQGETVHQDLSELPWYAPDDQHPWQTIPTSCTSGECAISRSLLKAAAAQNHLRVMDMNTRVLFENRFNQLTQQTRSKAAVSFTLVAGHLQAIWEQFGQHAPFVAVDRQSGRMHYRELLQFNFPDCHLTILDETSDCSSYRLTSPTNRDDAPAKSMTITFQVQADSHHMPVALASMVSKYTREMLMHRFQSWFTDMAPHVEPTAGYATDGKRFWEQIQPLLTQWGVDPLLLKRQC